LTTRCRLSTSDQGTDRVVKARIWFGFWKSLFWAWLPLQIVSLFFDGSSVQTWEEAWPYYVPSLIIFVSYFSYHQSRFVSGRQSLRDRFEYPNKRQGIHESEIKLYDKKREEILKYLEELRKKKQKRREDARKALRLRRSFAHRVRFPRNADDFEEVCAEWMRAAGYQGAQRTPKGPDGGADVISNRAVAQAKMYSARKVTAEEIRALVGTRQELGKAMALFFVYGLGFTPDAIRAAVKTSVQLFQLDVSKQIFTRLTAHVDVDLDDVDLDDADLDDVDMDDVDLDDVDLDDVDLDDGDMDDLNMDDVDLDDVGRNPDDFD
jgi:hypothetical protein